MKKIVVGMAVLCAAALVALAEIPVTTVTPENAGAQEVAFDVRIEPDQRGNLTRVTLRVTPKSAKYGKVGTPGVYLHRGETLVGCVALFPLQGKDGERPSYWCDLAPEYVADSKLFVNCYPETPDESRELDVQSREYVLPLKQYLKKDGSPKKPEEGK